MGFAFVSCFDTVITGSERVFVFPTAAMKSLELLLFIKVNVLLMLSFVKHYSETSLPSKVTRLLAPSTLSFIAS